ncbi:hypothetical protein IWQ61_002763 [Dispira simplex]|nr:hypothetical protein IWQ61_002763 [Dispira simplex]
MSYTRLYKALGTAGLGRSLLFPRGNSTTSTLRFIDTTLKTPRHFTTWLSDRNGSALVQTTRSVGINYTRWTNPGGMATLSVPMHVSSTRLFSTTPSTKEEAMASATAKVVADATTEAGVTDTLGSQVEKVANAAMQYGDLKAMGLVNWTPVGAIEALLEMVHVSTGLPWWGTIVVCTLGMRLLILPFAVRTQRNSAKIQNLKPEVDSILAKLKRANETNDTHRKIRLSQELSNVYTKNGCHPASILGLSLIQMPLFLCFFMAIRKMANLPVPQFQTGGISWFTDLTVPDPLYILPVASALSMLAVMEIGAAAAPGGVTSNPRFLWFMRLSTLGITFFGATMPAGLFVYWSTANFLSIFQTWAFRTRKIRTFLNIPEIKVQPKKGQSGNLIKDIKARIRKAA